MNWHRPLKLAMPIDRGSTDAYTNWGHQNLFDENTRGHEEGLWVMDNDLEIRVVKLGKMNAKTTHGEQDMGLNDLAYGRYEKFLNPKTGEIETIVSLRLGPSERKGTLAMKRQANLAAKILNEHFNNPDIYW